MGKAIGIDLGTTNSVVAFKDVSVRTIQTGANNEDLCRSCVAMDKNGNFIVGNSVFNAWKRHVPNIVVSAKRLMGASINDSNVQKMKADKQAYPFGIQKLSSGTEDAVAILLHGKEFTPEQISAEILRALKNDASTKLGDVEYAVITVPAYFNEKQKSATKKAAKLAGLKVLQLLAEPTAAALSYGFDNLKPDEDKTLLIYDFGGGTFDLSILTAAGGQFVETGAGGDRWLGGDDIDIILSDYIKGQIESQNNLDLQDLLSQKTDKEVKEFTAGLKADVENAKKTLSQSTSATIFVSQYLEDEDGEPIDDIVVSRDTFEALIRPLIERTIDLIEELLAKTSISADDISNILLVGGSSCIPLVKRMLVEKYGEEKILSSEKPMLAIAHGAAILAASMDTSKWKDDDDDDDFDENAAPSDGPIVYTAKHNYLIQLQRNGRKELDKLIEDQTPLPYSINRQFSTTVNDQKIVEVCLFNDAEDGTYEKITSGFFNINENLPAGSKLNFTFNLDEDETLRVKVKVVQTGKISRVVLGRGNQDSSCLSEISSSIEDVMNDDSISDNKKATFMSKIQNIIDVIEKSRLKSEDDKWLELEQQVKTAKQFAIEQDEATVKLGVILATILVKNFRQYVDPADYDQMSTNLKRYESASDKFQRESIKIWKILQTGMVSC
ncbi:Hsp70 family protein [Millionella massiliensis]|uniref:Hsp70 family protein n=1 Tax=Millionella massiliensis TaxID=1871023 RepID=UPI000B312E7C|nr:Hsp70 family protein [Millionella massiliensis]